MNLTKSKSLLATAFLLSVGANAGVHAQQFDPNEGVVRITDGGSRGASRPNAGPRVQQAGGGVNGSDVIPAGFHGAHFGGRAYGDCQNGYCQDGCDQSCQGNGCHGCFGEHYCKVAPDYGYSPPAKYPLHRRGVEYTRYYPDKWYGAGGDFLPAAPMVYQPTDTTQLGFYYQHVPTWAPQANRVPARPIPSQWHITAPPVAPSGFCNGGNCNGGDCFGGDCFGGMGHHGLHGHHGQSRRCRNGYGGFDDCNYGYGNGPVVQDSLFGRNSRLRAMAMARRSRFGMDQSECVPGNCSTSCGAAPSCSAATSCAVAAPSCGVPTKCASIATPPGMNSGNAVLPVTPVPGVNPSPEIAPPVPVSPPGVIPTPPSNQQKAPAPIPSARSAFKQTSAQAQVQRQVASPAAPAPQVYQALPQGYQPQQNAIPNRGYVQPIGYANQPAK